MQNWTYFPASVYRTALVFSGRLQRGSSTLDIKKCKIPNPAQRVNSRKALSNVSHSSILPSISASGFRVYVVDQAQSKFLLLLKPIWKV